MYRLRIPVLLLLGMLCAAVHAGDAGVLLVGNKSAHTLWALDLRSGEQRAVFDTGRGPHEVEVSPDARLAVVSNYGERERAGHTAHGGRLAGARACCAIVELGEDSGPHGMAFLPDGRLARDHRGQQSIARWSTQFMRRHVLHPHRGRRGHRAHGGGVARCSLCLGQRYLERARLRAGRPGRGRAAAPRGHRRGRRGCALTPDRRAKCGSPTAPRTASRVVDAGSLARSLATLDSVGFPIRVAITAGRPPRTRQQRARRDAVGVRSGYAGSWSRRWSWPQPGAEYKRHAARPAPRCRSVCVIHPDGTRAYVADQRRRRDRRDQHGRLAGRRSLGDRARAGCARHHPAIRATLRRGQRGRPSQPRSVACASITVRPSASNAASSSCVPLSRPDSCSACPAKAGATARNENPVIASQPASLAARSSSKAAVRGALHHQRRVAFALLRIGQVVVDAVAVEGQRREAEQQGFAGHQAALQAPLSGFVWLRLVQGQGLHGRLAVDDGLALAHRLDAIRGSPARARPM
jgi:hypothetical protein